MENEVNDTYILDLCKRAKSASKFLANSSSKVKNAVLISAADKLLENKELILAANREDLDKAVENGIKPAMIDRLKLTSERIDGIAEGVRQVAGLPDPVGNIEWGTRRPNGLEIIKKRVPLGVIGIVFESRPNVSADCSSLTIKSGNAAILRGGKEALNSNLAIVKCFNDALSENGLPADCVILLDRTDRKYVNDLFTMREYVDALIPRGGKGLISNVVENSKIPVIQTGTGNCHIYIDDSADIMMALDIVKNAKTQRPSVCNAMETLLVSEKIKDAFLPECVKMLQSLGVDVRGCDITSETVKGLSINKATELDYQTEYDDLILAVKVVKDVDEAIEHINAYGTGHSESIITKDYNNATKFQAYVDAACVYVNSSTRFTDGFEFGFGAEIGISNQKLHARGPMGLTELTTIKYCINGNGQIRG